MMHMAPATGWDIRFILRSLSAQNDAERQVIGFSPDQAASVLIRLLDHGPSEVTMHQGQPATAFGIIEKGEFNETWFIATNAFFAAGTRGLRYSRARVKHFREHYGKPLRAISYSPVAEAPKWFKVLGFVEDPAAEIDGAKVFIYR